MHVMHLDSDLYKGKSFMVLISSEWEHKGIQTRLGWHLDLYAKDVWTGVGILGASESRKFKEENYNLERGLSPSAKSQIR